MTNDKINQSQIQNMNTDSTLEKYNVQSEGVGRPKTSNNPQGHDSLETMNVVVEQQANEDGLLN